MKNMCRRFSPFGGSILAFSVLWSCTGLQSPENEERGGQVGNTDGGSCENPPSDCDGDGQNKPQDCDDTDPDVNSAADEACNSIDDNCDGYIDEGCPDGSAGSGGAGGSSGSAGAGGSANAGGSAGAGGTGPGNCLTGVSCGSCVDCMSRCLCMNNPQSLCTSECPGTGGTGGTSGIGGSAGAGGSAGSAATGGYGGSAGSAGSAGTGGTGGNPGGCVADWDCDGISDLYDNCRFVFNPNQLDSDGDTIGNACDSTPNGSGGAGGTGGSGGNPGCMNDWDCDQVCNPGTAHVDCMGSDNCPTVFNPPQSNYDRDALGDACDDDADGDGHIRNIDDCDDFNPLMYVGGWELCGTGRDENCNGSIDEGCGGTPPGSTPPIEYVAITYMYVTPAGVAYENVSIYQEALDASGNWMARTPPYGPWTTQTGGAYFAWGVGYDGTAPGMDRCERWNTNTVQCTVHVPRGSRIRANPNMYQPQFWGCDSPSTGMQGSLTVRNSFGVAIAYTIVPRPFTTGDPACAAEFIAL